MKHANFTQSMQAHGVRRVQRHEPNSYIPREWFAVELDDSRMIGTGPTVADAYAKADLIRQHLTRKDAA